MVTSTTTSTSTSTTTTTTSTSSTTSTTTTTSAVDAIMSMNNRGLPKIWRKYGRTFKLHKQVGLHLQQLDEMYSQLQLLRPEDYIVLNYTDLLAAPLEYAALADRDSLRGFSLRQFR